MRRVAIAVFLLSVSLLGFEVTLLQTLSFLQWHHFASMVISIALLGFGAAGTIIAIARDRLLAAFDRIIPWLLTACALAMAASLPATQLPFARFDSYLVFVESAHSVALVLTYLILTVPFLLGAMVIGLAFVKFTDQVGQVYFANLLGSGFGAILPVALMWWMPPEALAPLFACGAAGSALVVSLPNRGLLVNAVALSAGSLCLASSFFPPALETSQFKGLRRALDLPDATTVYRRPSPMGRVDIISTPVVRHAPGLSLQFDGVVPSHDLAFVNGNSAGVVSNWSPDDSLHVLDYTTLKLPYLIRPVSSVLALDAATGDIVTHALSHDVDRVLAIEPNVALTNAIRLVSPGVLDHPQVEHSNIHPRSFLRRTGEDFDLIALPDAGQFGGSVGLDEMQEDYLMTVESLEEMWSHLSEEGGIVVRAWMDYPYRYPLRVAALLSEVISRQGFSPREHLAAVRSWTDVTFVATRKPISPTQSSQIRSFSEQLGFDPLLLPDIGSAERHARNQLQDSSFFAGLDAVVGSDRDRFISEYAFELEPPTDDRPYFSRFLRWRSLASIADQFGGRTVAFFGLGLFIGVVTLLQALVLSILLIIIPLFRLRTRSDGLIRTAAYFASIGLGFMFVEIVLIQRFTLYLGDPVHAVSLVLCGVLVGSGLGAYRTSRVREVSGRVTALSAGIVAGAAVLYAVGLTYVFEATFVLPLWGRAFLTLLLLAPISYAMGRPFPLGLRLTHKRDPSHVPWGWGVNGCLSVVAAAAAPLISIEFGLTVLLVAGSVCYVVSAAATLES